MRSGVMGSIQKRLLIDQNIPTIRNVRERKPDLVVRLQEEKRVLIFDVTVAWEPLVKERDIEKERKYQELAADLANQWPGFRIQVYPVVVGDLGLVVGLKRYLQRTNLFETGEIDSLMQEIQREALCGSVRIIRRHLIASW